MAIGAETHTGFIEYEVVLQHTPTGVRVNFVVNPYLESGATPPEATRDQLFQGFLNHLATLANTTIISATKKGKFSAPVTVT